jgi:hypothetical protein
MSFASTAATRRGITLVELVVATLLVSGAILLVSQFILMYTRDSAKVEAHERSLAEIMIPVSALRRELKVAHRAKVEDNGNTRTLWVEFQDHDAATQTLTVGQTTYVFDPAAKTLSRSSEQLIPPGAKTTEKFFGLKDLRWCIDGDALMCPLGTLRPGNSSKRVVVEIDFQSANIVRNGVETLRFITDLENLPFDKAGVNHIHLFRGVR